MFDKLALFLVQGALRSRLEPGRRRALLDGTPILVSRSGYTGEVGFELFVERQTVKLWEALMAAGEGVRPDAVRSGRPGLAARGRRAAALPSGHRPLDLHPQPLALRAALHRRWPGFTKTFLGSAALDKAADAPYTLTFVGHDFRKVDTHDARVFLDGKEIGTVLTCVSDMAIGRHEGRIYSIASPDKPAGLTIKGLSCGFIKVGSKLAPGTVVELRDAKRAIQVLIETDVRPDRTARKALKTFL